MVSRKRSRATRKIYYILHKNEDPHGWVIKLNPFLIPKDHRDCVRKLETHLQYSNSLFSSDVSIVICITVGGVMICIQILMKKLIFTQLDCIGASVCSCIAMGLQIKNMLYFVYQCFTRVMFTHKSTRVLRGFRVFPSSVKADRSMENVILIVMCMLSWFYREATLEEQNGPKCHPC